jgi:hypothetical protein
MSEETRLKKSIPLIKESGRLPVSKAVANGPPIIASSVRMPVCAKNIFGDW